MVGKNSEFDGRKGDWNRKARDDPVNKRIFDLFGLDSAGFCSRLAEIYRFQANKLEARSKRIKTRKDLLSPKEFEDIVRFQPHFNEQFFNTHVLPYSKYFDDWRPTRQIPFYKRVEELDWKNPKNSIIPEENSEESSSSSSEDGQEQRIHDDFEDDRSTIVAPATSEETTVPICEPLNEVENSSASSGESIDKQQENIVVENEAPIQVKSVKTIDLKQVKRKQTKHLTPKFKPYSKQKKSNVKTPLYNLDFFKMYFRCFALPGQLPDLGTCRSQEFKQWVKKASQHKPVNQFIVDKCVKFIDNERAKETSKVSRNPNLPKSPNNKGTNEKPGSSNVDDNIRHIREFLEKNYELEPELLEGTPRSNALLRSFFNMVRQTKSETRKEISNKK